MSGLLKKRTCSGSFVRRRKGVIAGTCVAVLLLSAVVSVGSDSGTARAETPAIQIVLTTAQTAPVVNPNVFGAITDWASDSMGAYDSKTSKFYPQYVKLLKEAGVKSIRFVDGNSARCCFEWQRAVGPMADRSDGMVLDGLQGQPSTVGPDELASLVDQIGADGMAITNFDRQSAQDAADWVAYMTAPTSSSPSADPSQPSYWAALRAANGHPAPYPINYWDVGNEEDLDPSGWITGQEVNIGSHSTTCTDTQDCLYAFGGTTAFANQPVVGYSDLSSAASLSTGAANQTFYASAPPVAPSSQTLYVGGTAWQPVTDLSSAGPSDQVYAIDDSTGEITFGDGVNGAIPPSGSQITLSYQSGPHDGYVQYYAAMKAMNPNIQICSDAENAGFFQAMGTTYPYDCVSWHLALGLGYPSTNLSDNEFMKEEFLAPTAQGAAEVAEQQTVDQYAGRDVPVLPTAYGHLAGNQPSDLPNLHLSLIDGLVQADQLEQWISLGVPMADRYQLNDETFAPGGAPNVIGNPQAAYNVLIDSNGQKNGFILTPDGLAMGLMSRLAGQTPIGSQVSGNPTISLQNGLTTPTLTTVATESSSGKDIDLVVVNQSLDGDVTTQVNLAGLMHGRTASVRTLNGASATSYNTPTQPNAVSTIKSRASVGGGSFTYDFPAHSVTLIELKGIKPEKG
jgi:alpha-L-arabinofuranosidase